MISVILRSLPKPDLQKVLFGLSLLTTSFASAGAGISYEGQLLKPTNAPVNGVATEFRFQIRSPGTSNCLLYEEKQVRNLNVTNGNFAISIGDGSGLVNSQLVSRNSSTAGPLTLNQVFENSGSFDFSAGDCTAGTTYSPANGDGRSLVVLFKDPATMGAWEPLPAQMITYAPFAIESQNTQKFAGLEASQFLRSNDGSAVSPLSNAEFTKLNALIAGSSTDYARAGYLSGALLPALTNGQTLGWSGGTWTAITPVNSTNASTISNATGNISLSPLAGGGSVLINSGTASLSNSTGALIVSGGVGVTGAINSGGSITANGPVIAPQLKVTSSSTATNVGLGFSGSTTGLFSSATDVLALATAGAERMIIDSAGSVGIGTSPFPSTKFSVSKSGSGPAIHGQTGGGTGATYGVKGESCQNTGSSPIAAGVYGVASVTNGSITSMAGGRFESTTTGGTANGNYGVQIVNVSGGANNYGLYVGNVSGGTNNYSIFASATAVPSYFAGNVGIGTTAPAYKLDVAGAVNAQEVRANGYILPTQGVCTVASQTVQTTPTTLACTNSAGQAPIPSGSAVTCTAVSNNTPGATWSSVANSAGSVSLFASSPFSSSFVCLWMHP